MDNFQKAQRMAKINLMREIIAKRPIQSESLERMATELMQAGNNKTEIVQILTERENLHPNHQRVLEKILQRLF